MTCVIVLYLLPMCKILKKNTDVVFKCKHRINHALFRPGLMCFIQLNVCKALAF